MKLVDLLVQELPKRGGWPKYAEGAAQDKDDTEIYFFYGEKPRLCGDYWSDAGNWIFTGWKNEISADWDSAIVSREQYEQALAASKQVKWDGEGLPPIGAKIEVQSPRNSWTEAVVVAVTNAWLIARYDDGVEFAGCYRSLRDDGVWEDRKSLFRPIRTEAERKREEYIAAIIANLDVVISTKDDAV